MRAPASIEALQSAYTMPHPPRQASDNLLDTGAGWQ